MYQTDLTIPPNTSETSPEEIGLTLNAGTLKRILAAFPVGCLKRARATIYLLGVQIEPWNPEGYLAWDGYVFEIPCDHKIPVGGTRVTMKGWNLDTTYPHTIYFTFDVIQEPIETTESLLKRVLRALVGE